jgi:transcriptional regulator with XRE-family HTH domain
MKMKQPDLGKKIAELRKARGLTQEELVEKCNLSVRTLQRIESGEVMPRSHTLRVIFAALDYKVFDSSTRWFRKIGNQLREWFNLKTNTMKKLSILSLPVIAAFVILLTICTDGWGQSASKAKKFIEESNRNLVNWFNEGQVDSILTLYREDACIVALGCGQETIRAFYESQVGSFEFEVLETTSLSVSRSLAVEKGRWSVRFPGGNTLKGEYLTEWRKEGRRWLIVNDMSDSF